MARRSCDEVPKYRLEKLSIGFVSVMFGFLVFAGINGVASADTLNNSELVETSQVGLSTSTASQSSNVASMSVNTSSVASSQMSSQSVVSQASQVSESAIVTGSNEQSSIASQVAPLAPAMPVEMAQMQMFNVQSAVSNVSNNQIQVSAVQDDTSNGGFDSSTWGTLDVSKWTGKIVNNTDIDGVTRQYYELTGYTGDMNHIIVPNEADLEAAGINTGGYQVGVNADMTHSWFENGDPKTIAFSKTDNKMVKALGSDWTSAFTGYYDRQGSYMGESHSLSKFDGFSLAVSNVTNTSYMFYDNRITSLASLASWKTDNVVNMSNMFDNNQISDLTPLANWKTDKVIYMSYMFYGNPIHNLTPLSSWNTDNVTNMNWMFSLNRINDLTPLASWKTDKVTNMSYMFYGNLISDLTPLASWKTDKVTNMSYMFYENQISDLTPLASWKTDNVTNMSWMFYDNQISDLTPLANWKTDNVTDMSDMFNDNQISDLTPLANWKTDNVTDMSDMFDNNKISDLTPLNNWKTDNVTNMAEMFANNKISDLTPLASWNTDNVTSMNWMFSHNQISNLTSLASWKTDNVTNMTEMFSNNQISDLTPLANWKTDNVIGMNNMFSYNRISDLTPLASWKTDNVTDMSDMFSNNQISNLTSLANWKTDNVTDMSDMFSNNQISNLTSLASWKTDNVTDMSDMFSNNQISNLAPLTSWKTDNVTSMDNMFSNNQISNLAPLTSWKTDNVINMGNMFSNNQISDLTPLSNWKTDNVINMGNMFSNNQISNLTSLANWKTDNVTDMSDMFSNNQISDLTPLANWKTDNVTDMSDMFSNNQVSNLTSLAGWKIDNVYDMSGMFASNQIKLADFRKWDLNQFADVSNFIGSGKNAIILVNSANKKLLLTDSVINTVPNIISINSNSIDMPTLYVTDDMNTPAEELAEKLVEQARAQKIADYQKAHPTAKISLIMPDPTNHAYDAPAIMANQKYRAVFSNKITYQFVDDDNNNAKVGNAIIVSGEDGSSQKTNLVVPVSYELASGQSLPTSVTIPTSDTVVVIHLVHTQYNVVIKYLDLSGSQVGFQTITGKWGTTKQVGTLQIPQNYVLQSVNVPTQVEIQPEDTELDLVVAPTETYRSFVTSKDSDLHRAVTRLITVTLPDKSTKTVVQTVSFGRNAWTNNRTHQVTYSDWQADGPQKFVAYIPDAVSGYVSGVVKSQQVLADSQDVMVSVGYTPIQQAVKHPYIDASGHVYDAIPTGYHVVAGQTPSNGAMLLAKDVVVKPVTVEFVTRTVTIKLPNNHVRVIHQRVRKGTQFGKVAVPHLRGYKVVVSNNASLGRVAADQDMNLTVTFEKL